MEAMLSTGESAALFIYLFIHSLSGICQWEYFPVFPIWDIVIDCLEQGADPKPSLIFSLINFSYKGNSFVKKY